MARQRFDAVVVGTGLVGGWTALRLTQAGMHVLVLEAGPALAARPEPLPDHAQNRQPIQSRHGDWGRHPHWYVDDVSHPYRSESTPPFLWIRGRQPGGRSLMWGGTALRFSDCEFSDPERDGVGFAWPLTHADLSSHYGVVERTLGVCGSAAGLLQLPDGAFVGPSHQTDAERRLIQMSSERALGLRVLPARGIPADAASAVPARSSMARLIPAALATGRLTMKTGAIVARIVADDIPQGVRGVEYVDRDSGASDLALGARVFLCASTIESVRILLNSRSPVFPDGLGNSAGLLGSNLTEHWAIRCSGRLPDGWPRTGHAEPPGGAAGVCIPRFVNLGDHWCDFHRGYGVIGYAGRRLGTDPSEPLTWAFTAIMEVAYQAGNRISLADGLVDDWGIGTVAIALSRGENDRRMVAHAQTSLEKLASALDLPIEHWSRSQPGQFVHELGGAHMGRSPATSVLDTENRCWDAPNVWVLDGACFPTAGWQNPTLTMLALAERALSRVVRSE
ncbi:MAG: GMC family oxidoreductase [Acidobacteriota bacterium]